MSRIACLVAVTFVYLLSVAGVATQQPAPATVSLAWAFPDRVEKPFPEDPAPKSVPGSTRKYTMMQIDDLMNPPDWFPDQHPTPPQIVLKGHDGAMACGACHLMSGLGHPESSDLTGLSAPYIVQQMIDFKSGARKDPTGKRMNGIAMDTTEQETREAAEYFAALPRRVFNKVIEAEMVPRTFLGNGRMRFVEPGGAMEPIAGRIITVPEDQEIARLRHPTSGFVSYVPPGSLARGKKLIESGVGCGTCHGHDMKGIAAVPRLAGMHPIYTVRQLQWFKDGTRNGTDAALMKPWVATMTMDDMVAVSAYLGSLEP